MRHLAPPTALTLALVLGGCKGVEEVEVKGRVTYNGKPLAKPGGQIVFVGPQGTQVAAPVALDGTYSAAKVPAGPNRVAVYYPNPVADAKKTRVRPQMGQPPLLPPAFLTPLKYASPDTSDLTVRVGRGTVFDAQLTGPKIP